MYPWLKDTLQNTQEDDVEYCTGCKNSGYHPKRIERWLRENKRDEEDLIEVTMLEFHCKYCPIILLRGGGKRFDDRDGQHVVEILRPAQSVRAVHAVAHPHALFGSTDRKVFLQVVAAV